MKIKLIVWIIGMLLIAGSVSAGLTDGLTAYYKLDNNNYTSSTGSYNALNQNTGNTSGIINDGRVFAGEGDQYLNATFSPSLLGNPALTISAWIWLNSTASADCPNLDPIIGFGPTNANQMFGLFIDRKGSSGTTCDGPTNKTQLCVDYYGNTKCTTSTELFSYNQWTHIVITKNTTHDLFYINGTFIEAIAHSGANFNAGQLTIGIRPTLTIHEYKGKIDEVGIWNMTLNATEITQLYNSGSGFAYPFAQMTISGITPANGTNSTVQLTAEFTYTSTDSSAGNCTLYINGIANATNNSIASGSAATLSASGMGYGYYNWSIGCLSTTIAETSTGNFTYYLDPNAPVCNFPASVMIGYMEDSYTFNVTCTDEHFYSLNVSCDGDLFEHFIDGLDTTAYNFANTTVFTNTTACSYEYCDGHTDSIIDNVDFIELPVDKDGRAKIDILKDAIPIGSFKSDTIGAIITPTKLDDRISFKVDLKASIALTHTFYYTTLPGSKYIANADFPGWIITYNSRSWFDMKSKQVNPKDLKVKKLNSTTWEFTITTSEKLLEFESTGSLNCVTGSFNILYEADYTFHPGTCPADTAGSIMFTMLVFFCLGLMAFAMIFRIRFFGIFAALMLIGLSWSVAACAKIPGLAFGGFAIVALIWFAVKE